ncbi:MAG: FtsX-like permease family protein [Chloroflexi bacterium]|nr:FtsX-like permease family protein [Chloroflexota bacterium]
MQEIFGLSMTTVALVLLGLFIAIVTLVGVMAWRNRIMLKLGLRNIPKRPAQTALIILGLMLSTVIITSAFGTGDTIAYTIRSLGARTLGSTDEIVSAGDPDMPGGQRYFEYSRFEALREELADYDRVDGLLPCISLGAPLVNIATQDYVPSVNIFAPAPEYYADFTDLKDVRGGRVSLDDLEEDQVYLDEETAKDLEAGPGASLYLFFGEQPAVLELRAVIKGASSGGLSALLMPLSRAQQLLGRPGQINAVFVSNQGDWVSGARYSDEVKDRLEGLLEGSGLKVETAKKEVLEQADLAGSVFTTIFVSFGLFSIAAGVLLIFLIFMMLAAARKSEMGMARAVGTRRRHLIQMFIFEGAAYDLAAAVVGVGLGVAVTYAIAGIVARIFQDTPLDLAFHFEARSLVVAFTLGILVTFITVALSSWRVSRLNIVRAIRDIPEPKFEKVGRRGLILAVFLLFVGSLMTLGGIAGGNGSSLYMGISLAIIGLALLLRRFGVRERPAFTLAGSALLVWTLLPMDALDVFGELSMGIEMFFLSGMIMVLGAVWVVIYNLNALLGILTAVLSRLKGVVPALRTALAYPMQNRGRTGLTLAMFSLVIFTMIFMSTLIATTTSALEDVDSFSGGYDIAATVSYSNPIPDIDSAIAGESDLNGKIDYVASQSTLPLEIRQVGAVSQEWEEYVANGVDDVYLDTTTFDFVVMAEGYGSAREVWQAIRDNPGLAVVSSEVVPSKNQFGFNPGDPHLQLEGVYQEDETMSPIEVELRDPYSDARTTLTIIGVLEQISYNFGIYTSQEKLAETWPVAAVSTSHLFKLEEGVDARKMADTLESVFLTHGMEAASIEEQLKEANRNTFAINSLLQGFMSLGLVVGIAALGVISTRAVVERRHEVGVMRAIGYRRGTVQLSFLLESSIVALLGILIGVVLGLALSYNVIDFLKGQIEGLEFQISWLQIVIIVAVAYLASLLMTLIPAWQASRIYPAEALRYE